MTNREKVLSVTIHDCEVADVTPIPDFPDYFVCAHGDVFSAKKGGWRKLKPQPDRDGYLHVVLVKNGRLHTIKIQRIVASVFLGPKPDGMVVCHNDGNKVDNSVSNLRYDTQRSNIADIDIHGTRNPPRGEKNGQARLTKDDVLAIRLMHTTEKVSHSQIAIKFGISREHARDIINRKFWTHV